MAAMNNKVVKCLRVSNIERVQAHGQCLRLYAAMQNISSSVAATTFRCEHLCFTEKPPPSVWQGLSAGKEN